jgi:hypothetical protein
VKGGGYGKKVVSLHRKSDITHLMNEMDSKTQKHFIPEHGVYMYARTQEGRKELIVLNNSDEEQVVDRKHFHQMIEENHLSGQVVHNGQEIDISENVRIGAHESLVIVL